MDQLGLIAATSTPPGLSNFGEIINTYLQSLELPNANFQPLATHVGSSWVTNGDVKQHQYELQAVSLKPPAVHAGPNSHR